MSERARAAARLYNETRDEVIASPVGSLARRLHTALGDLANDVLIDDEDECDPCPECIREAEVATVLEFAEWVATNRAYNGSPHQHGQSLYNECLNAVLGTWVRESLSEAAGADLSAEETVPRVSGAGSDGEGVRQAHSDSEEQA